MPPTLFFGLGLVLRYAVFTLIQWSKIVTADDKPADDKPADDKPADDNPVSNQKMGWLIKELTSDVDLVRPLS